MVIKSSKEAPMSQETARAMQSEYGTGDLIQSLLLAGLIGGGARAGAGIVGSLRRNLRRKREREKDESVFHEISFPVKRSSESLERPDWTIPATVVGLPLAAAGGWMGVSKLIKAVRKSRDKQEMERAKAEFEEALANERGTKFAFDLDKLAKAWVSGDIDNSLEKAGNYGRAIRSIPPALYTAMTLLGLLGTYGGWKVNKGSSEDLIEAHREAMRRRQLSRPVSLVARSDAYPEESAADEKPDKTQKDAFASASNKFTKISRGFLGNLGRVAGSRALSALIGVGSGLGATYLLPKFKWGRDFISGRAQEAMKHPDFAQSQASNFLDNPIVQQAIQKRMLAQFQNPEFSHQVYGGFVNNLRNDPNSASALYEGLVPTFVDQLSQRRPIVGKAISRLLMPRQMHRQYRDLYG